MKSLIYGNGESRQVWDITKSYKGFTTWGCNAIYRDAVVDNLVAIDYGVQQEIYALDYFSSSCHSHAPASPSASVECEDGSPNRSRPLALQSFKSSSDLNTTSRRRRWRASGGACSQPSSASNAARAAAFVGQLLTPHPMLGTARELAPAWLAAAKAAANVSRKIGRPAAVDQCWL